MVERAQYTAGWIRRAPEARAGLIDRELHAQPFEPQPDFQSGKGPADRHWHSEIL